MSLECSRCERDIRGGCDCRSNSASVYGMCTACGSVEVALNKATGTRDLSYMGESASYPIGFGCEVCS